MRRVDSSYTAVRIDAYVVLFSLCPVMYIHTGIHVGYGVGVRV